MCKHKRTRKGKEIELRYGSHITRKCLDCKMWRQYGHNGIPIGRWKKLGYKEATKKIEEDY